MVAAKKQISLRLSDKSIKDLESLQKRYQRSAAAIIALAIHAIIKGVDFDTFEEWLELPD